MTFLSHTLCSSGFYSGFSGSLCGLTLVQLCTCREKPMNVASQYRGLLSEAPDRLASIKIQMPISNYVSMWGQRRRGLLSIEPTLGV